ncbi:hypothetical protein [Phycicoccus sp. Soil748]|uniref:hypothetical protein n=1 Tax=Phycicoccus sp. Soil748 TaxID=1736397 RepID=UPI000B035E39|nr:hypothetical protein [Phycicoccus sp. Soil748]
MFKDESAAEKSAPGGREIDRRAITKGVAWTVPVVIVATAAPAAAASGSVSIQSVAATYVPASASGDASITLVVSVKSTGRDNTISFSGLAQGANPALTFTQPQSYTLGIETKSFTMTTGASPSIQPTASNLRYSTNTVAAPDYPVTVDAVTALSSPTPISVTTASSTRRTFTFNFSALRNSNSKLTITSVVTAGLKQNGSGGPSSTWPNSAVTRNDIGTGVSVTLTQPAPAPPSQNLNWAQTVVTGALDNVPFSYTVNGS